jgi:DNA-binding transcriptional MerR regulator
MKKPMKLSEVLKATKINKRTFEYYQSLGLLPRPTRQVGPKGRGVLGLYDPEIVALIKKIQKLKKERCSLKEIEIKMAQKIGTSLKNVLKAWGFSSYGLPELRGFHTCTEKESIDVLMKNGLSERQARAVIDASKKWDEKFEALLLQRVNYGTDKEIERLALLHILEESERQERFLFRYMADLMREQGLASDKKEQNLLKKILKQKAKDALKLLALQLNIKIRLSTIEGEYEGATAQEWIEEMQRSFPEKN